MKNSFNDMEDAESRSFFGSPRDQKIRDNINDTLGTMRFLGHIADVYVNRLVDTMVEIVSGPDRESTQLLNTTTRGKEGQRSEDDSDASNSSKYPNQ